MEELSYIQMNGARGEILHGSIEHIASRILMLKKVFDVKKKLSKMHFGVLGNPNMLICSEADPDVLLSTTGIRTTELSMGEIMKEIDKKEYHVTPSVERLFAKGFSDEEVRKALYIYGAIKRLVERYGFDGVAVRCFDLLAPYNTSGCLALALLNEEGIYAACEADTRSLLSMTVLGELSGRPVFMANPSRMDVQSKKMVFAHCVLPLNMPESFELTTHFESGIGIAIKGYLKNDVYTLFKCRENMKDYFVQPAEFVANLNDACLCRTQIELRVPDIDSYLKHPLSNHQMIAEGDWSAIVNEFFKWA
jgi:L-fucose isomerase and related proteins